MSLLAWAERAYAAPGASALCLALQDRHGQSVCLLLWTAWAALSGLEPARLGEAADLAQVWEESVIGPLRTARRELKSAPGIEEAQRAALRAEVQASELAAERALLAALEGLAGPAGEPRDAAEAMARAAEAWGAAAPIEMLRSLAAAFRASA